MALAYDLNTNLAMVGLSSPVTFTHTITGLNPVLLVGVSCESNAVAAITYNGATMALAAGPPTGASNKTYIYYMAAPPTGTNTVSVSFSGSVWGELTAISLTGADQLTPVDVTNMAHIAGSTSPSTSVVTKLPNDWLVDYITNNSNDAITVNAAQTQRTNVLTDNRIIGMSTRAVTTPGSYAMNWTSSLSDTYDHVVVAVKEVQNRPSFKVRSLRPHPFSPGMAR